LSCAIDLSSHKTDWIVPEGRPGLFGLIGDERKLVCQAVRQAFVVDKSQLEFRRRLLSARVYCYFSPIERAKPKVICEFFSARCACFHGNLLVLWQV